MTRTYGVYARIINYDFYDSTWDNRTANMGEREVAIDHE